MPSSGSDPAARRVARTDHEVRRAIDDRPDDVRQDGRIVRPVGVHLEDDRRTSVERDLEAVEVGPTEPLLGRAMTHADPGVGGRQLVGDAASAVG